MRDEDVNYTGPPHDLVP